MIRVLVAGDYSPAGVVADLIEQGRGGEIFTEVRMLTAQMDYSAVNFESTVAYAEDKPIKKSGPPLSCSPKAVMALKEAGFDMVTLANNHFADYGQRGVEASMEAITAAGLDYVGGGRDLREAQTTLFREIKGKRLAFINCCEHEFSIAEESQGGSNPLDPVRQYYKIKEAREQADYTVMIVHGGHEHFPLPSLRMRQTYRFFVDAGADAVINHHQHCYSGWEMYHGKPITYGLGNLCFDGGSQRPTSWYEGYAIELDFNSGEIHVKLHPYTQCKGTACVTLLKDRLGFDHKISLLNAVIADDTKLRAAVTDYYEATCREVFDAVEPIPRLYHLLHDKLRLRACPAYFKHLPRCRFKNVVCCESHLEKLRYALEKLLKGEL